MTLLREPDGERSLSERIEKLTFAMEKMNLSEYITLIRNPWRLALVNFMAGTARGLGIAFGFAVLSALLLYVAQAVMWSRLPLVGSYIATIVRLVEHNLRP